MRRFAPTILVLSVLLLSGCSTIKLAYNQADTLAAWMANDYFDLEPAQRDALRPVIDRFHAWHRKDQLPEYAALMEVAAQRFGTGISRADVAWAVDSIKVRYRGMVMRGHADASRVLSTLSDTQIAALRRRFDKLNREYADEYAAGASVEEQRRRRAKRTLDRIEHWTGSLSAAQEARITELSRALPLIVELRQQDRIRRQREFLALLEGRGDLAAFAPRLRDWLLDWERSRSPEYEAAVARLVDASADLYVEVERLLTPEQRQRVLARIQRYAVVFRELAAESPAPAAATVR